MIPLHSTGRVRPFPLLRSLLLAPFVNPYFEKYVALHAFFLPTFRNLLRKALFSSFSSLIFTRHFYLLLLFSIISFIIFSHLHSMLLSSPGRAMWSTWSTGWRWHTICCEVWVEVFTMPTSRCHEQHFSVETVNHSRKHEETDSKQMNKCFEFEEH